jgi:hypothetical protein
VRNIKMKSEGEKYLNAIIGQTASIVVRERLSLKMWISLPGGVERGGVYR